MGKEKGNQRDCRKKDAKETARVQREEREGKERTRENLRKTN